MKLTHITVEEIVSLARFALVLLPGLVYRRFLPDIWLISERKDQARDNGYRFLQYLREQHPDQDVYYLIDRKAADYRKVQSLGKTIQFDSWRHYLYFCATKTHISAHVHGCFPSESPICRYLKPLLCYREVLIPHGVSYGIAEFCLQKHAKIDLYICSGKPEYDNVLANYGYTQEEVAYTGFPRLDYWWGSEPLGNMILVMPTWRMYLAQDPNTVFEQTTYFRAFNDLLHDRKLIEYLMTKDLHLVFYLHSEMQKYAHCFVSDDSCIEVVYDDKAHDIQELLRTASLLVTDYSSVHFDFAYMNKPVVYYQFDKDEFYHRQYVQTSFDAKKDGFGPVADDVSGVVECVIQSCEQGFAVEACYHDRMRRFYQLYDQNNCARVYEAIYQLRSR